MELMNARGVRDFPPEEKIVRQQVIDSLRATFELYGFAPLETPIIERLDVLSAKYAGGAEILKEIFTFRDQGKRDLCLRYDLTVPLARFVGMNQNMKLPFKRYAIGRVFRDGPIKLGRYREFWQCDVDIIGSKSQVSDAECVKIAQRFFKNLELDVTIEINTRKLLDGLLEAAGVPDDKKIEVILEIDKLKKVGIKTVTEEITKKGISSDSVTKLIELLSVNGKNSEKISELKKMTDNALVTEGLAEIENVLSNLDSANNSDSVEFNISLARGLAYYTGTVFEVFMNKGEMKSSLAGGGRYDKLIGNFLGGKEFPAVGISFGIEPITEVLKISRQKEKEGKSEKIRKSPAEVYIIPIGTNEECIKIAEELRDSGIKTDMDINGRGVSKNLNYANALGIPFAIFVGEEELKNNKLKLRDMNSGEESLLSVKDICEKLD